MKTTELCSSLYHRYQRQKSIRVPIEYTWDEIDYYTGPSKDQGYTSTNPFGGTTAAPERRADVWDHTAVEARSKLAASLQGAITSTSFRWFSYAASDNKLSKDSDIAKWLDAETENIWNLLQESDFYTEISAFYNEYCGPGHAFFSVEPIVNDDGTFGGFDFQCIPLRDSYFEQNRKGGIKTFWQRFIWQPSQVVDFFESRGLKVPEDIQQVYDGGETIKKYEFVMAIWDRGLKKTTYPAPPEKRPWGCVWFRADTSEQVTEEDGYYECPIFHSRWYRTAGSKWGHGLGTVVLPTVRYVNGWREQMRTAGEKSLEPSFLVQDRNVVGDVDLKPGGVTVVRNVDGIRPLESGARFDISSELLRQDQDSIRRLFHMDDLELKDSPAMTATEAQIRYEWMTRLLGQTLSFLQQDILSPVLSVMLAMRVRMGASAPMPDALKRAGGVYNVKYHGPLARSQRSDEVAAIERGATFVGGLSQIWPEVRACLEPITAVKYVFSLLGVPADILPPDAVLLQRVRAILQQQSEMAQSQAQLAYSESAVNQAKAAKDAAAAKASTAGMSQPAPGIRGAYPEIPQAQPLSLTGEPI